MLHLTPDSLDQALNAIQLHGYGEFFPEPPEFSLLASKWNEIRAELTQVDLDLYEGYDVIFSFAPKSRLNVRRVALLHPYDLIFYTALVLALRDGITSARLAPSESRVFSYHAEGTGPGVLYNDAPGYREFKECIHTRISAMPESYVGMTDIADFYPRIYQHRVINALQAACGISFRDHIRALEKMLTRFSENVSYGIPIGPPASRLLGEAVLVDVDKDLAQNGARRSSESSLRHILRRKLQARNARDHERYVELVAARLIEQLRCTRDAYQHFVDNRKCHPPFEAYWAVLRFAVFPTAIELLRQDVIEYTKLTQVPAQHLSLLFGIPTHVCYEDVTSGFGVMRPPNLDDRSLASDTELESLGRLLDDGTVLHFEDIKNGGAIFQLFGGGPFAIDDQGSIHRSWGLCGLQQQFTLLEWVPIRAKLWHLCSPWSDGLVAMFAAVQEELLSQRGSLLLDRACSGEIHANDSDMPQGVHAEAPEAQEDTTGLDRRRAVIISKVKNPQHYRVLTIEEATLYFEVAKRTVYRWLEEEKLRSGARRGSITIESIRRLEAQRSRKRPSS